MIYLTGHSGFVGNKVVEFFGEDNIKKFQKGSIIDLNGVSIVLHFAGKSDYVRDFNDWDLYYEANTNLTKVVFDKFLESEAHTFITLSSVKAVADSISGELFEDHLPNPNTFYGKSKLLAEKYIFSKSLPVGKNVFVLRPPLIYGPGVKGNFKLIFNLVRKGFPWPLGSFENSRSYCNIQNLLFVINELVLNNKIPSGIYNVSDDGFISSNGLVKIISDVFNVHPRILCLPKWFVKLIARIGDFLPIFLNSERLCKLTDDYKVSNFKIKSVLNKPLPVDLESGLRTVFQDLKFIK